MFILLVLIAFVTLLPHSAPAEPLAFRIQRKLHVPADDGQQGVATDGQFLYVTTAQRVFKYDRNSKLIQAGPRLEFHHGGAVYRNGKLYVAVSKCKPEGTSGHWIHVYDPQTLQLTGTHDISPHFSVCAGAIAYRQGHFFVAESFFDDVHHDRIVEFDGQFRHIRDHAVNFKSPFGIQGLEYLPGTDQFQVHSHGRVFYRINSQFAAKSLMPGRSSFDLQDVARLDDRTLVVNHRDAEELLLIDLAMDGEEGASSENATAIRLARPTPAQVAWHDLEMGVFIHWGVETFLDVDTDTKPWIDDLKQINPPTLDTDQWVAVAESMGANYIIIVAKHHGGFCLWPTETTPYNISNTPWRDGRGDVLKDLSESCRRRGMRLGVYVSPADFWFGAIMGGGGKTARPEQQEKYIEVYRQQLKEVLSHYGPMVEVWFDGSLSVIDVGDILAAHAPGAMVFQSKHATIRWVGNEEAVAPYPAWNSLPGSEAKTGVATAFDGHPDGNAWLPNECDGRMRATWFWNSFGAATLKSVDDLMDRYYRSVGRGAVMLLNVAPNTAGAIPKADVQRAAEFGAEIRRRFGAPIAHRYGKGTTITLDLGKPTTIDHVVTMEEIDHGERVRQYVLEGETNGQWNLLADGSAIGHKKIDAFEPAIVSRVRLRVTKAGAEPILRELSVYYTRRARTPSNVALDAGQQTVGRWEVCRDDGAPAKLRVDLTRFIPEAGQYEVRFQTIRKDVKLKIASLTLFVQKQRMDSNFVRVSANGTTCALNITATPTGHPESHVIEVTLQLSGAQQAQVTAFIERGD